MGVSTPEITAKEPLSTSTWGQFGHFLIMGLMGFVFNDHIFY
jgi:hypothetical protein